MEGLFLTIYGVLLLVALVFAGIIIYHYHVLKYYRKDFPAKQSQHAMKMLWVYIVISATVLIASVILAIFSTLS